MPKKIYIRTFGCQMNLRDSEFVTGILLDHGFRMADSVESADIILFNSCSVRKHAEDRLFSNISDLKRLKKVKPALIIGLIGCTAQEHKDKILKMLPMVDLICGPGNEADLPALIKDIIKNGCPIVAADKINEKRPELFPAYRERKFKAYVSISEGCDNFCSYCIVPYVRGRPRSRDAKDIIKEAKMLAENGFKEITLLGQNVNSYREGEGARVKGQGFVKLLERLNNIGGIERIRFMTSHPKDASTELFRAMRGLDKVCEHLHLPLQSGSDRILKLMNRGYTAKKYLKLIEDYRKFVPEGSVTTDLIVGFPSETESDFEKTLTLSKKIGYDGAFMFKYSPRPPAASARLKDDVSKEEKEKRLECILRFQCDMSRRRNEPLAGETVEVLVDGRNEKTPLFLTGRTRTNKTVIFEGDESLVGRLVDIKVESVTPHTLRGRFKILLIAALIMNPILSHAGTGEFGYAEKLFLQGRYEKVIETTEKLIESRSGPRDELYYIKGLSELKTNRFPDARESFGKVISKFQSSRRAFDARVGIGDSYFLEGDIKGAIEVYEDIVSKFPKDRNISAVYYRLGDCHKRMGANGKSRECLYAARRSSSLSFEARTNAKSDYAPQAVDFKSPAPEAGNDYFSVQAGCFKNRANAERLSAKLTARNYYSYVEPMKDSGATLYRVRVGRYKTRDEAKKVVSRLNSLGYAARICSK